MFLPLKGVLKRTSVYSVYSVVNRFSIYPATLAGIRFITGLYSHTMSS